MFDRKIETFLAVVKYESYTLTANKLHMTQPAVTQHIHKLEQHYGCKLIDSSNRSIKVSETGKLLYAYLSMQKANEASFEHILQQTLPPLCIGATLSIADYYLPEYVSKQLLQQDQRVRIVVENTASLIQKLHDGTIDCAFIEGSFDSSLFETFTFLKENFIPVVSIHHPCAHKQVSIQQIYEYPLVLREPHSGTREIFEQWLHQRNDQIHSFHRMIEIGSFTLMKHLIAQSNAITFVYEGVVKEELENNTLCKLEIEDFTIQHDMHFVYRKGDPNHINNYAFFQNLALSS